MWLVIKRASLPYQNFSILQHCRYWTRPAIESQILALREKVVITFLIVPKLLRNKFFLFFISWRFLLKCSEVRIFISQAIKRILIKQSFLDICLYSTLIYVFYWPRQKTIPAWYFAVEYNLINTYLFISLSIKMG